MRRSKGLSRYSLDLLAVGSDQQTLAVYIWDHGAQVADLVRGAAITDYKQDDYVFVKSNTFRHPQKVLNVVPGDFTQDGKLDILVMGQERSSQVSLQVYIGLPQGGFGQSC